MKCPAGNTGRPLPWEELLDNSELLAIGCIFAGADFFGRLDLLVEDFGLDVFLRYDGGDEELRRRVVKRRLGFRLFALDQLYSDLRSGGSDDFRRLGDRVVLVARDDQLQGGNRRVNCR